MFVNSFPRLCQSTFNELSTSLCASANKMRKTPCSSAFPWSSVPQMQSFNPLAVCGATFHQSPDPATLILAYDLNFVIDGSFWATF
jgi:hypothetical protein